MPCLERIINKMKDWDNINDNDILSDKDHTPNFIIFEDKDDLPLEENKNFLYPIQYAKEREPKNNKKSLNNFKLKFAVTSFFILIGSLGVGVGIGTSYSLINNFISNEIPATIQHVYLPATENIVLSTLQPLSMVDAVETVKPAVVSIETRSIQPVGGLFASPIFDIDRPASGTGIIFYEDETNIYIVTNEHVIGRADLIEVSFGRNRNDSVEATVVGTDFLSDIAVIAIPKADLEEIGITSVTTAEFGNSSDMHIGEFVMAIGNALGQGITTTMGVVSATDIQIPIDGRLLTVLQTDAAINPGNSGGPLINSSGQVIGINTVKLARPNVYGMGYSITSNIAMPIIDGIMNDTPRPMLGIMGQSLSDVNSQFRLHNEIDFTEGVIIGDVQINSGAYRAGLRQADIITHFDGEQVIDMNNLRDLISQRQVGDNVSITVIRDNTELTLNVQLVVF